MLRAALLRGRRPPGTVGPGSVVSRRGDGYEFIELRAYQPGDDPRRIDWAATARSGLLQTRVLLEHNPLEIATIVDRSASMQVGRSRGLVAAAEEADQAWFEIAEPGDRRVPIGEGEDVPRALLIARHALRRSAVLLVVSDFHWLGEAPHFADLALALGRRLDVTALVARDPWYNGLPLRGFVRLRDAENGSVARLYLGKRERLRYRLAVQERERAVCSLLRELGWRTGILTEDDGRESLYGAFGLP